jgi:TRAP-type C4-dicarboxylate transport system permease small subunit
MDFLRRLDRGFDKLMDVMLLLSGLLVLLDTVAVAQDVIIRKSFDWTWAPLYELLTFTLVWITFLGCAAIYRDHGHVKMDSILGMLSKRARTLVDFITSCAVAVLCVMMLFLTARLTLHDAQTHFVLATIMNPIKWPIEIIIPIAFLMLFVQAIRHAVVYLKAFRSGESARPAKSAEPSQPAEPAA